MVQIDAYKLLFVGEQIILGMVKDITDDQQWLEPLPGLNRSIDRIYGHCAAVEDWFLHHLNDVPDQLPDGLREASRHVGEVESLRIKPGYRYRSGGIRH